ncbi:hypothetical protein lerEdw1_007733 [Lerista edwardsae]|nr:hypothetical protein lerEdw1_007733 [Lerista edwardsae]
MEYKKLYTIGLEVPDNPTILQFKKWVRKFLWENAENGKLIGVHCTNGINRTGYLICRYLIDVEGWDPETAIQVFGEARGHHMDRSIYLTDLKTQPMRSNLGMNMWDSDGDIMPPPHDMAGHVDRFPNEDFPRPGKRLRVYQDGHPHCDLPGQMQLREFDFINKGPGQRRKRYNDHQFQDDIQPLLQMRQRPYSDDQFYDECQEEMHLRDLDFAARESGQRPFHDHQFSDNFLGNAPAGEYVNRDHGQRQRLFPEIPPYHDRLTDMEFNRGCGQKRRPFYDPQCNDEFRPDVQLRDPPFRNKGPGQRMRNFHDDMEPPVDDIEFFNRGRGQRMMPFIDDQHYNDLRREMPFENFDNRDAGSRCRPFHDHQSYDDFSEEMHSDGFVNRGPGQRMRPFNDDSLHNNLPYEGYLERDQPYPSHEQFPGSPLHHRDYSSDTEDYNRNCRPDCPEGYRRIRSSNETNRGGKTRFVPYPAHSIPHPSPAHQKGSSVSTDYGRRPQCEIPREMDQGKKLQVVTIDYNYGLPLDCASEKEDRAHYNLPPREYCSWK